MTIDTESDFLIFLGSFQDPYRPSIMWLKVICKDRIGWVEYCSKLDVFVLCKNEEDLRTPLSF